jgi:hypothetical protein
MVAGEVTALAPLDGMTLLAEAGQHGSGSVGLPGTGLYKLWQSAALLASQEGQHGG